MNPVRDKDFESPGRPLVGVSNGVNQKTVRALVALVLAVAAGGAGYAVGTSAAPAGVQISAQTVGAPAAGTVRVLYSLDQKQNDKEIIALINGAKTHIYFAIYVFTLRDVADALIAARERGVDVRGLVDSGESANSYGAPIIADLVAAGIPVLTEKHPSGNGIMHIKALVTDSAYAVGSYNWTISATTLNDEILEIGTDPALRQAYENILRKLFTAYAGNSPVPLVSGTGPVSAGVIDFTKAPEHIGEYASVRGTLVDAYTSKSGTVFLDFCRSYKTCPFTAVIFADDAAKFGDLSRYEGTMVTLTGKISLYKDKAEIILSKPDQISN